MSPRRVPATTAELRAWSWGVAMADRDPEGATTMARLHGDPGSYLDDGSRAAWDRLGPREFWTWALAGLSARMRELDGVE